MEKYISEKKKKLNNIANRHVFKGALYIFFGLRHLTLILTSSGVDVCKSMFSQLQIPLLKYSSH